MRRYALAMVLCLALVVAGCANRQGDRTLTYKGAIEEGVGIGARIPGSDIQLVSIGEDGARLLIDDQPAVKKMGDSLDWSGAPVPGVHVVVTQRVLWLGTDKMQTGGVVTLTVSDALPQPAVYPDKPSLEYHVATTYTVRRGQTIPGTLVSYVGKNDAGAELAGVSGYPYRKLGDSIGWSGRLRNNVFVDETLRVIAYTDDFLQVAGLAKIGLTE